MSSDSSVNHFEVVSGMTDTNKMDARGHLDCQTHLCTELDEKNRDWSPTPEETVSVEPVGPVRKNGPIKQVMLVSAGILFVLLAAIGVFLPGLPATGPLILASICLTKSCPSLERRLVRSKFFSPFQQYLDGNAEMPLKARLIAIGMMWTCICLSSWYTLHNELLAPQWVLLIASTGFLGTWVIWRLGRRK